MTTLVIFLTERGAIVNPHLLDSGTGPWAQLFLSYTVWPQSCTFLNRGLAWYSDTVHERYDMGIFDQAFASHEKGNPNQAFSDPDFGVKYPVLHAYLTRVTDDQDKPRRVATLLIFCEDGTCKAALKERDHDLTLWVSASSILGVLEAVEEGLCKRPIEWRSNQRDGSSSRTRR